MKNLYIYLTLFSFSLMAVSQSLNITGPSTSGYGEQKTYTVHASGINLTQADGWWYASSGNSVSPVATYTNSATCYVTWNQSGSQTISYDAISWINFYTDSHTVNVSAPPTPTPSAPTVQTNGTCIGQATLQRGTPPSGITWFWQGKNSSGTSTTNSNVNYYPNSSTGGSGYYYLRARNNSTGTWSTSSAASNYVTVSSTPAAPQIYNGSNSCSSNTITLFAESSETDVTHKWYTHPTNLQTVSHQVNSTTFSYETSVTVSQSVSYWVSAVRGTCESARVQVTATRYSNSAPSVGIDADNVARCSGSTFSNQIWGGVNSTFEWYDHPTHGQLLYTGQNYQAAVNYSETSNGTKTFYVGGTLRDSRGCTYPITNRHAISVTVLPLTGTPTISSGVSTRCQGGGTTDFNVSAAHANSYSWSISPLGAGSINSSGLVTWDSDFSGTATVSATATGTCNSTTANKTVTVTPLTGAATISGGVSSRCQGSGTTDYNASASNANGYNWSISPGSAGSINGAGLVTWNGGFSGTATVSVTATGSCNNTSTNRTVTVQPLVGQVSAPAGTPGRCQGSGTDTYTASASNASSYTWAISPAGAGSINSSGQVTWDSGFNGTATITVTANSSCNSTTANSTVSVNQTSNGGSISGSASKFGAATGTLTLSGQVGSIVKWQYKTTGAWQDTTHTSSTLNYTGITETTQYQAIVKNGLCSEATSSVATVTILALPTVSPGVTSNLRPGQQTTLTTSSGYTNYEWFKDNVQVQNGTSNQLVVDRPGNYKVTITYAGNDTYTTEDLVVGSMLDVSENSVVTYTFRKPVTDSDPDAFDYANNEVNINAAIYDGLGRSIQNVSLNSSPNEKDVIAPIEYDDLGRRVKEYLPYVGTNVGEVYQSTAMADQPNFYSTIKGTTLAYSETRYEASPLNRPLERGAPGASWQIGGTNTISYDYAINGATDVIKWDNNTLLTMSNTTYPANELHKNTVTDEDGNQTIEYINKQGQTILKQSQVDATTWVSTYYIYDDFDQLSVVLPPEATARLDSEFFGQSAATKVTFLNTWAFLYDYDGDRRMTMKKVPGADSVFMVYDQWDRLVLTQDGVQRTTNTWLFTKYDGLNRPVMTGLATITGTTAAVRNAVNALSQRAESFSAAGINQYTDLTYPSNSQVDNYLTVTYYDNYDWDNAGLAFTNPSGLTQNTAVKGQVTGTLTKAGNGTWIKSASYYDDRYRVIQTQSTNHLGGTDVVTNYYDFIGQVTKSVSAHNNGVTTRTTTRRFAYDHAGRLKKTWHELSEDVQWTDLVGVSVNGNELTKTAATEWNNAGAASRNMIPAEKDGRVQLTMESFETQLLGLSEDNPDPNYGSIDFAIHPVADGNIYVFENGTNHGIRGTYQVGDVLSVEREGTTISYKNNDQTIYVSTLSSNAKLIADASMYHSGSKLVNARLFYEEALISSNSYNELGELTKKNLHYTGSHPEPVEGDFQQSLDYTYNIRGWLTSINDPDATGDDLFGMELFYDQPSGLTGQSSLYNGNISAMKWSDPVGPGTNNTLAYTYDYDKLNRLTDAKHHKNGTSNANNPYDVSIPEYDLNGNIGRLTRNGSTTATMDDLDYTYIGNRLQSVEDLSNEAEGFDNGGTGANTDYTYDENGNMISDANKGITSIAYNHLNLPTKVTFDAQNYIEYLYDAAGIKLQQKVWKDDTLRKTTDYVAEYIYENGVLQLIQHEEGRLVPEVEKVALDVVWTFNNDAEGFTVHRDISSFQQASPGHVEGTITGNDPILRSPDNLNLDAAKYDKIKIRFQNNSSATVSQIFFTTTTSTTEHASMNKDFTIDPNSDYTEYTIDMSTVSTWAGTIKQIRFDPVAGTSTGSFKIDEMTVVANSEIETYDYQYHLKDHLGNVRLTFSTTPENYTMVETFETGEDNGWQDLHRLTRSNANTTVGGDEVELLQSGQTGAMLFLSVNKGDTLDLSVNANYETAPSGNTFLGTAYNSLFTSFDNVYGSGIEGGVSSSSTTFNTALSGTDMGGKDDASTAPRAFLNYIFFDKDMNYKSAGFKQISTAALGVGVHETISINDILPEQDGYILAYLSNENNEAVNIHWDDFTVYHGKTNVVSTQDYYPFGLTFNESVRVASTEQRFKYNGKELQTGTDWLDYGARMYQPEIGRFFVHDRFAEKYMDLNPYQYGANNPIFYIDVNGDSLVVNGTDEAKNRFVSMVNNSLGGQATISLDENGLVTMETCDTDQCSSEAQEGFAAVVSDIASHDNGLVTINVVESDNSILGDSFNKSTLDVGDLEAIGDGEVVSTASMTAHALEEQKSKQLDGKSYRGGAHDDGKNAETKVTGATRVSENVRLNMRTRTGTADLVYRDKNGQNVDVRMNVQNGRITGVTEKRKRKK